MNGSGFTFTRLARTVASESYVIFNSEGRVGLLDIHIQNSVSGNLIIEQKLSKEAIEELIDEINDTVISGIEPREDFIFSVFKGKEIGFYSDGVEESPSDPVRRGDIDNVSQMLQKVLGRHQRAKGQLNEFIACEFFEFLGYKARKASHELDHLKVDVTAHNSTEIVYVQVKAGQIGNSQIRNAVKSISGIESRSKKLRRVAFVASEFPANAEILRGSLEQEYGLPIWYVHGYQVVAALPQYKDSIERTDA
jgi:Holliday junction resolvase-like predicted endonuclease